MARHPFHNLDAEDRREAYNEARWPWLFAGFWIGG